ncbi:hypothetical protein BGZ72_007369 [Mortierella alpina]|nr:hypothetical protein BGZ72_007369 [Mortierella alpina]
MHFLKKSSKNKTASAVATPFHTPRTSLDGSRPSTSNNLTAKQQKEAQEAEVLYNLISKAMSGGRNGPYILRPDRTKSFASYHIPTSFLSIDTSQPQALRTLQPNLNPEANSHNIKHYSTTMPFFKSSSKKNKTASAATTPAQTPRNSMHEQRDGQPRMTQDEAMHMIFKNSMPNAATGPFIR